MLAVYMRTDNPEAELFLYEDDEKIAEIKWEAHRRLADTLHIKLEELLSSRNYTIKEIQKIGIYEGPGSFTGLRIGMSVANTLGYALAIPVVQSGGEDWLQKCIKNNSSEFFPVSPEYGSDPHITQQKK